MIYRRDLNLYQKIKEKIESDRKCKALLETQWDEITKYNFKNMRKKDALYESEVNQTCQVCQNHVISIVYHSFGFKNKLIPFNKCSKCLHEWQRFDYRYICFEELFYLPNCLKYKEKTLKEEQYELFMLIKNSSFECVEKMIKYMDKNYNSCLSKAYKELYDEAYLRETFNLKYLKEMI